MNPFLDISRELTRWYSRRLRYLIVTAVGEGTGLFISAAVLLIVAGLFLRNALEVRQIVSESVDRLLNSAQMPTTDDDYVIPVGLLNSEFPPEDQLPAACANGSSACQSADAILNSTVRFARLIVDGATFRNGDNDAHPPPRGGAGQSIATLPSASSAASAEESDTTSIRNYLVSATEALQLPEGPLGAVRNALAEGMRIRKTSLLRWTGCQPQAAPALSHDANWALPEAWCLQAAEDLSELQLPAEISPASLSADRTAPFSCSDGEDISMDCRVYTALKVSYALEAAIRLAQSVDQGASYSKDAWRLTAAYFISVDSVFRFWRPGSLDPLVDLPTNRLWASRKYFVDLLAGPPRSESISTTEPYLDYAGAGLVQTRCRAVALPRLPGVVSSGSASDPVNAGSWRNVGIVCADLALRRRAIASLLSRLGENPLVRTAEIDVDQSGAPLGDPDSPGPFFDKEFWALANSPEWRQQFDSTTADGSAWRRITRVGGSTAWYVVPLGRDGNSHHFLGITPSGTHAVTVQLGLWTAVGVLGCGAIALFTVAGWQSRRVSHIHQNLARLLSLPGAAVETRYGEGGLENEVLVYGNDQAEELLQKSIRRFGEEDGPVVAWWDEFDPKSLRPADPITQGPSDRQALSGVFEAEDIKALRKKGALSAYYMRFRHPRTFHVWNADSEELKTMHAQWVRVVAVPVMSPTWRARGRDPRAALESTFGVVTPVFDSTDEGRRLSEGGGVKEATNTGEKGTPEGSNT